MYKCGCNANRHRIDNFRSHLVFVLLSRRAIASPGARFGERKGESRKVDEGMGEGSEGRNRLDAGRLDRGMMCNSAAMDEWEISKYIFYHNINIIMTILCIVSK